METIGNLIDKLAILSLKEYFTNDNDDERLRNIATQKQVISNEINQKITDGIKNNRFEAMPQFKTGYNKKYEDIYSNVSASVSDAITSLIEANIKMWHTQNKIMNFESVPQDQKDSVVDDCSRFNLERNKAMDEIDFLLNEMIKKKG